MGTLKHENRIKLIREYYPEKTFTEIAKLCNCSRTTLWKSFSSWTQSDDYNVWIHQKFMKLLSVVEQQDPAKALNSLARLIAAAKDKRLKLEGQANIEVKLWRPDEPDN